MKFSLVICTYMRPEPLLLLLESVKKQTVYPNEILIIDGSFNDETEKVVEKNCFEQLHYFKVSDENRGLTKQRNYGIERVAEAIDIICFLDDDTVLERDYFEKLMETYQLHPDALGVGGYIHNETKWDYVGKHYEATPNEFYFDGWKRKDGSRFVLRKKLGLDSNYPPGYSSLYSHGRSVGFLPPSGKIYEVELIMGGVSSFRKEIFENMRFSTYFEGYGLYEDADFSLRVSKMGPLYLNTKAKLSHYHADSGRPNQYRYGKMVVRNGWFVWRTKNPNPKWRDQFKWHSITILLTVIRFSNTFTSHNKNKALTEAVGRTIGWLSLLFSKPK
ncbi:glycosyltransferase family 2 protein [Flavobacterium faecale]|uniref:glycosyltransferase family 2 protein n=1 Tax=Flavobacterium faecale TaxID=1355330 RepID=UPI003AAB22BA